MGSREGSVEDETAVDGEGTCSGALRLVFAAVEVEATGDELARARTYDGTVDAVVGEPSIPGRILNGPSSVVVGLLEDAADVDEGPAVGGRDGRTCSVVRAVMLCAGKRDVDG